MVPGASPVSVKLVVAEVPACDPLRRIRYPLTPTLSLDAFQVRDTEVSAGVALRPVGALGGEESTVTIAWACSEGGPMFPTASSAVTL